MGLTQFTIRQLAVVTALVAVVLSIFVTDSLLALPLCVLCTLGMVIAPLILWFRKVPFRYRLPIEVTTAVALLSLSAVICRSQSYLYYADLADEVAGISLEIAATVDSPPRRDHYQRVAVRFARKASTLRWESLWIGLTEGPARHEVPLNNDFLVLELTVTEARQRLELEKARAEGH